MTVDLIETLKTSICSPKTTKNTKIHFQKIQFSKVSTIHIAKKEKEKVEIINVLW